MKAFSNDELNSMPDLNIGDVFVCSKCGKLHEVQGTREVTIDENGNAITGEISNKLMFYSCGDSAFLAGVNGKNVM